VGTRLAAQEKLDRLAFESARKNFRRSTMNKDQIKGTGNDIAGKVQQKVGEMTGNTESQIKGMGKQVKGKVQKGVGDVKDAADDAKDDTH
jgi:uncharacterized protein YjbJ (UPF0337 family)